MATYKMPCIHCGMLVERDARFCPGCGSASPFNDLCPSCLRVVKKEDRVCAGCGRPLRVSCPHCAQTTFAQARCERCGQSLTQPCPNPRCGVQQFFENTKCTACGKKLKR
ncbi:MAG: zinc ribbon domain-containing protein [Clostridiaceae bacterium]|nr:zinc ribbon domain-containing protein [Eubacteriales bacterium]